MMSESKIIKINLKTTIEDFYFAYIKRDNDTIEKLEEHFENIYNSESLKIQKLILRYILNDKIVIGHKKLFNYFNSFVK